MLGGEGGKQPFHLRARDHPPQRAARRSRSAGISRGPRRRGQGQGQFQFLGGSYSAEQKLYPPKSGAKRGVAPSRRTHGSASERCARASRRRGASVTSPFSLAPRRRSSSQATRGRGPARNSKPRSRRGAVAARSQRRRGEARVRLFAARPARRVAARSLRRRKQTGRDAVRWTGRGEAARRLAEPSLRRRLRQPRNIHAAPRGGAATRRRNIHVSPRRGTARSRRRGPLAEAVASTPCNTGQNHERRPPAPLGRRKLRPRHGDGRHVQGVHLPSGIVPGFALAFKRPPPAFQRCRNHPNRTSSLRVFVDAHPNRTSSLRVSSAGATIRSSFGKTRNSKASSSRRRGRRPKGR